MKKMYLSKDGLTLKRVTKNSEGDIVIPEGVVYLAKRALAGCEYITEVSLPSTLKELGEKAFEGCTSLKKITIPEGVENIPKLAFSCCSSLEAIALPSSLKKIETGAFKKCLGLTRIVIPEGVCRTPYECFAQCENIEEVILPEGIVEIGEWAFECCCSLSYINLPESLEIIDDWAFRVCRNLNTIKINPNIMRLGAGAFQSGCIRNLMIGALTEPLDIGDNAFYNTPIYSIVVDSDSAIYEDAGCNVIMEKETGKVICGSVNSVIPNDATSIMSNAFGVSPKFLEIPSSVKKIQKYAFSGDGCTFIVKDGVEVIEECAFMLLFWSDKNDVYIPASVHTIEGQLSTVEFHLEMANPFFFYDIEGKNIISVYGKLVWGQLLQGIPENDVNEVLAVIDIDPEYSELIIPGNVRHVGSGIFGADFTPFERIIVNKGTTIDFEIDEFPETQCEIKVVVPTAPSVSGITKNISYTIPKGTPVQEMYDYLGQDSI